MKQYLENVAKIFAVLNDACKFLVVGALSIFIVAAMIFPAWGREQLGKWGLVVKQVNVFGITIAAAQTFDMADALSEAKLTLGEAKVELAGFSPAHAERISNALAKLDSIQSSLNKQNKTLQTVQENAGIDLPAIPDSGWIYVGLVRENGTFVPGVRIDPKGTAVNGVKVSRLTIRADSPVVGNGGECVQPKRLEDIKDPTPEELRRVQVLIGADDHRPLDVIATKDCPAIGNMKMLYAEIRIRKEDVKFAKFETLLAR